MADEHVSSQEELISALESEVYALRSRVAELEGANSVLRAALVVERAKILYYLDMIGDESFYHWEDVEVADHVRGEYLEKARAALGNSSETPISSGMRRDDE